MSFHQYFLKLFCCFTFIFCLCFNLLFAQQSDSKSNNTGFTKAVFDRITFWKYFHYPDVAYNANVEGPMLLKVHVNSKGKITKQEFIVSLGPLFEKSVSEALQLTSFAPATNNGIPYATIEYLPFKFTKPSFIQSIKYNYHEQIIFALGVLMKIDEENRSEYLYLRGKEHFKEMEYEYANDDYNEYTSLVKENQKLFYEDDILKSIVNILPIDTVNAYSLVERGSIYRSNYLYDKSLKEFNQALSINNKDSTALLYRAQLYNKMKEYEKSTEDYLRLILHHNYGTLPYVNIGWNYYMAGDMEKSIEFSERAIEMTPNNFTAMYNRAIAYLKKGNLYKAKSIYQLTLQKKDTQSNRFTNGAIEDLKDLIHDKIMVEESKEILKDIFKVSADSMARCW